jgi:polyribonucleotide nucleotidyltransferase
LDEEVTSFGFLKYKGETIKSLSEQFSVKITLGTESDASGEKTVTVASKDVANVSEAIAAIKQLTGVEGLPSKNDPVRTYTIPADAAKLLMGKS